MLNKSLTILQEESLCKVRDVPNHHLNLGRREAIYRALGPKRSASNKAGYKRRVLLAKLAIVRMRPVWEETWPKNNMIKRIFKVIDVLTETPFNEINEQSRSDEINQLWEYITELTDQTRNIAGVLGMAAVRAYALGLWDFEAEQEELNLDKEDSEDFMYNDEHFYASVVCAGGPPYSIALAPKSDPAKRLQFWEWWLLEAVPEAWGGGNL